VGAVGAVVAVDAVEVVEDVLMVKGDVNGGDELECSLSTGRF